MSLTFTVLTMLLGVSVVTAFVLQSSEQEPAASANSPVSHHRSVSNLCVQDFVCLCNVLFLLGVQGTCETILFKIAKIDWKHKKMS